MEGRGRCVRVCLAVYTVIFVISGLLLVGLGINLYAKEGPFATLLPSFPFLNAANLVIIIGFIVLIFSVIGCLGAWKEQKWLLLTFFMLLFVVFLLELVAGCLGFVYRNQVEQFVTEELTTYGLQRYGRPGESGLTSAWDRMQTMLMCCGVIEASDWSRFTSMYRRGQAPDSCCFAYYQGCGLIQTEEKWYMVLPMNYSDVKADCIRCLCSVLHFLPEAIRCNQAEKEAVTNLKKNSFIMLTISKGCRDSLVMEIEGNIDFICIIAICVALLEILGMCLSYSLYKIVRTKECEGDDQS